MLFHITYEIDPGSRDNAQAIFKETGGLPAEGVEMVGRCHCVAGLKGYLLARTDDGEAIARWLQDWTHLIRFNVDPVIEDEEFARILE